MTTMTEAIQIDGARALALLREAVAEAGPENRYTNDQGQQVGGPFGCYYAHNPGTPSAEPGCIVGRALHLAGLPVENLAELDTRYWEGNPDRERPYGIAAGPAAFLRHPRFTLYGEAHDVFQAAQTRQDRGDTFGDALAAAEDRARARGVMA